MEKAVGNIKEVYNKRGYFPCIQQPHGYLSGMQLSGDN